MGHSTNNSLTHNSIHMVLYLSPFFRPSLHPLSSIPLFISPPLYTLSPSSRHHSCSLLPVFRNVSWRDPITFRPLWHSPLPTTTIYNYILFLKTPRFKTPWTFSGKKLTKCLQGLHVTTQGLASVIISPHCPIRLLDPVLPKQCAQRRPRIISFYSQAFMSSWIIAHENNQALCDILGLSYITGSDGVSYITGRNGLS